MAVRENNVVLNFKMNGQVQYAQTLKQLNMVMQTAAKEYQNHVLAMGKDADQTQKLLEEKKKLETQLAASSKKVEMLTKEFEDMQKDTNATAEDLQKLYNKLLTAENAHAKLEQAMNRVSEGLSEEAIASREAEVELSNLSDEMEKLEAEQRKLSSAFELQNASMSKNASEVEKVELAQRQLRQQMQITQKVVRNLEKQLDQAKIAYGENSREVIELETKLNHARASIQKFNKQLESVGDSAKKAEKDIDGLKSALSALAGASPALAIAGVTESTRELSTDLARLKTNAEMAGRDMEIVNEAFKQTASITGEADSAVETLSNILASGFKDEQLSQVIDNINGAAIKFSDTLKTEGIADGIQETFATGEAIGQFAELLERSGVDLETFNEKLGKAKTEGERANVILQQMSSLGLQNVLDKYRELNPEIEEANRAQVEYEVAMQELGNTLRPLVTEVAKFTTELINWANENPVLTRSIAGVGAAIGAMVSAFSLLAPALYAMQNLIPSLSKAFSGFSRVLPMVGRAFGLLGGPIGWIITTLITAVPLIIKHWDSIVGYFKNLWEDVVLIFEWAIEGITNFFTEWGPTLLTVLSGPIGLVVKFFVDNWQEIKTKTSEFFNGIVDFLKEWGPNILAVLTGPIGLFVKFIVDNWQMIKQRTTEIFEGIRDFIPKTFQLLYDKTIGKAIELKDGLAQRFEDVKEAAITPIQNMYDRVTKIFENLKKNIGRIWGGVTDVIKAPINAMIELINEFIQGINSIEAPDWVPVIGGKNLNISEIPKLKMSTQDISVQWFAKGGIMTRPTYFGASGNTLYGGGEAGPEAILPLNDTTLGKLGQMIADKINIGGQGDIYLDFTAELDGEELVRKTIKYTKRELYNDQQRKNRAGGIG